MLRAIKQARRGRLYILDKMAQTIAAPRKEISRSTRRASPRRQDPTGYIKNVIGPGGKVIRDIIEQHRLQPSTSRTDGKVDIASADGPTAQKAIDDRQGLTA
jgi:polyribonucleotide nucleotidyltransferase